MITEKQKEFIREWVKDLRSGEYKQGKDCLYNSHNATYCCLGVACMTAHRMGIIDNKTLYREFDTDYNEVPGEWFDKTSGLTDRQTKTEQGDLDLTFLNDSFNWDFNRIADALEENFLKE